MSKLPHHPWNIRHFRSLSRNYWKLETNRKAFLKDIEKKLNISDWRDWYKVTSKDITRAGGSYLLKQYNYSLSKMIMSLENEHPWDITQFICAPHHYWSLKSNRKAFVKTIEKKLKILDWKDWYQVSAREIHDSGGSYLLHRYQGSPSKMVMATYPQHPWDIFHFRKAPQNFWNIESNRREFMKTLEKKLFIVDWKDWYQVTQKEITESGGRSLLAQNGGSPSKLIMSMYPQHPWNIFEFRCTFAWNPQLIQHFLNQVASSLQISSSSAWRTLSSIQIREFRGGNSLLNQIGSLYEALKHAYPSSEWDFMRNIKISKPQNYVLEILREYLPRDTLLVNFRHSSLIHKSGVRAELDIWIPSLNLALEYHGEHHFHQLWERSQHPSTRKRRDAEKRLLCLKEGIDLVEIPYWWDKSAEQLIGIIRGIQPLFLQNIKNLDEIAPIKATKIPNTEKITVNWHCGVEYSPIVSTVDYWYASEKLDGIRFHWDGVNVYSRGGHPIELLEPVPIPVFEHIVDGELWYGRSLKLGLGIEAYQPDMLAFDAFQLEMPDESV